MSGDYSRQAFDPLKNYSAVWLQQGRPLTDRDWNEQSAAVNRRAQAGTLDASGPVLVSSETPDAFKILPGLSIARGRMYVDGLLADNHGTGLQKWDTELAELFGVDAIPFDKQPYLPGATLPPVTGGPYLIYLDVWNREVNQFEDSKLVEIALGVDTTTRLQTVWQVKFLGTPAGTTCATPVDEITAWGTTTAPSAGRLTTATAPVPNLDPCLVPPAGGYKGLENQLYRVEVHAPGPLGTATFKWSRDNASVEARVTRLIDQFNIVVDSVGKDSVLRFSDGDWIEITDDFRELNGLAGELHKIKVGGGVDDATRKITLDKQLTAGFLGPVDGQGNLDATRNARIRRWDQKGKILAQNGSTQTDLDAATSTGAIPIPTGGLQLRLEDGIIVSFSLDPAGGNFHVGDYWVFAARAADASIEILNNAPPRGIHHHYTKLAVYTPPSGLEDCRPKKPVDEEACCCTVVVSPGEDIQAGIDSLPAAGGCVCLKTGIHPLRSGLLIARSNVKLVGESHGTIVRSGVSGTVLTIGGPAAVISGVEISMVAFEQQPEGNGAPVVAVTNVRASAILDCEMRSKAGQLAIGIQLANVAEFRIARCRIDGVTTAIFGSGVQTNTLFIDDNVIDIGIEGTPRVLTSGIVLSAIGGPCRIAGNSVEGAISGIAVNGQITDNPQPSASNIIIAQNVIACQAAPAQPAGGASVFGIDLAAHSSIVAQNLVKIPVASSAHGGIRVTGDNIDVVDNQVASDTKPESSSFFGIMIGDRGALTNDIRVAGNYVDGGQAGIFANTVTTLSIESNIVETASDGKSTGIALGSVRDGLVKSNRVTAGGLATLCTAGGPNRLMGNSLSDSDTGVALRREVAPVVTQNRIDAMRSAGIQCGGITGRCEIVQNRITSCGFRSTSGAGIQITQVQGDLHIDGNEIIDTGLSPDRQTVAPLALGITGSLVLEACISNNYVGYTDPASRPVTNEDRALVMSCLEERRDQFGPAGYPIQILGNKFVGPGRSALVEIQEQGTGDVRPRFERVFFSNNYCLHNPPLGVDIPRTAATVNLFGRVATVMGNQVKAMRATPTGAIFPSFNFNSMPGPFVGNVISGGVTLHADFPAPQANFNLTA
ncbi:DUF6519 domain-containing protein [Bradyrhizobium liaoningense]|uniref:DUF6519 domain-containing protein n=1 Tax=Bradyrhizobium liaoningense TaxID=43992 RepID=UPI001BA4CA68|nr:DUF6519 domain-containing protein [Bradyrhizobium liaoningense]MBR0713537.1 right-handed parallel beta-helix repeat-containing protein [Bradyrhizobium liaoningense]